MTFDISHIKKIAQLSNLAINDDQAETLTENFQKILKLVEKMEECNTENVAPLSHPVEATQPMRQDKVTEVDQRDKLQAIAPDIKAGLYIVPQFIETE